MAITSSNAHRLLVSQQFESFEQLTEIAVAWDADFRQLNAENFRSEIFQAQAGPLLLSNARFGCHTEQRGATPPGVRTFGVPDVCCPPIRWFGHLVEGDALVLFPAHGEIEAFTRTGFSVATFSIAEELLAEFFYRYGGVEIDNLLVAEERVITPPPLLLARLRQQLRMLQQQLRDAGKASFHQRWCDELQRQLLITLFDILESATPSTVAVDMRGARAMACALDYIHSRESLEPLRIVELSAVAKISERALLNLFRRELGMTPKAYVLGHRLSGVHRQLWNMTPNAGGVTDVANAWGFWHMGQFARDYRKFFGELPSQTLKRSALERDKY